MAVVAATVGHCAKVDHGSPQEDLSGIQVDLPHLLRWAGLGRRLVV